MTIPATAAQALPVLAALLVTAACFLAVRGIDRALSADRREAAARLDALSGHAAAPASTRPARAARPRSGGAGSGRVQTAIRRAGLAWTVMDYFAIAALTGAGAGLVTMVARGSLPLAMVAVAVGCLVPPLLVARRGASRGRRLNAQVAQTIELIASSLRAGFGFMQSVEFAAREQVDPIASELRATIREIEFGVSVDEALERLLARTQDEDLDLVVSAVLVQRRVGGDLGEVLTNIAQMIHDRVRIRGEIRTLTAQARMSAWVVGMLPLGFAAVMTALQPSHMAVLIEEPVGRLMVLGAAGLQGVGFLLVRRIAQVDY
ncbi:MAG: type II secretion system F family protein [Dehalococcoidia bacterium]